MREKIKKNDLQSEDREFLDNVAVAKQEPRVISFDVYFRKMKAVDSRVADHHLAPMRRFAEQKGLVEATEEQFEEIFRSY